MSTDPSAAQIHTIVNQVMAKKPTRAQLHRLTGGLLTDLLEAVKRGNEVDQEKFRQVLGLELPTITITVDPNTPFKRDMRNEGYELESDVKCPSGEITLELVEFLAQGESSIRGDVLLERAKTKGASLGWCHAEALLANQHLIPKKWRQYYIVFPGTVWACPYVGRCFVPYLGWDGDRWILHFYWLDSDFDFPPRLLRVRKAA